MSPSSHPASLLTPCLSDCCHSGSMLDHEAIQIEGAKEGGPPPPEIDVEAIQEMLAGMGAGPVANGQEGMVNKTINVEGLSPFLETITGAPTMTGAPVEGTLQETIAATFGDDAGAVADTEGRKRRRQQRRKRKNRRRMAKKKKAANPEDEVRVNLEEG
eukprot:gene23065-30254_t